MRSLEANRLRRRWRILVGAVVLCVAFVTMPVRIAYASNLGTAPFNGYYAICNVWQTVANTGSGGFGNWNLEVGGLCNVGSSVLSAAGIAVGVNDVDFGGNDSFIGGTNTISTTSLTACTAPGNGQHFYWNSATQRLQFNFCANVANGSGTNNATAVLGVKICLAGGTTQASYNTSARFSTVASTACPIGTNSGSNGRIDLFAANSAPWTQVSNNTLYPVDFFNGGSAGPALDANKGTSACSRTLTDTSAMTGEFTAGRTGMANATVTAWDWDWGDSTTHGTAQNGNHTYGALSTMPNGGWTSTVTMTVTATSGHVFADGTSSQTGTCQLRNDFLHPENMTAGSTGGSGTGDTSLDSCIPSGWNVLNPVALIGGVGCLLKKLFVPSSTTVNGLGSLWNTVTTHLPFSVITGFVDYIPNMWSDFKWQLENVSPLTTSHYVDTSHDTSPLCSNFVGGSMPNNSPLQFCTGGDHYPFTSLSSNGWVQLLRSFMLFIIVAMFVYAMWRGANEVLR